MFTSYLCNRGWAHQLWHKLATKIVRQWRYCLCPLKTEYLRLIDWRIVIGGFPRQCFETQRFMNGENNKLLAVNNMPEINQEFSINMLWLNWVRSSFVVNKLNSRAISSTSWWAAASTVTFEALDTSWRGASGHRFASLTASATISMLFLVWYAGSSACERF